jgi:hypothetical protein
MIDITIYDSEGEKITPGGRSGQVDQQVKQLSLGSVRVFAERTGNDSEITFFFRARETEASRAEMFYAKMGLKEINPDNIQQFTTYIENDIGLILANGKRDSIYGKLFQDQTGVPRFRKQSYFDWALSNTGQLTLGTGNMKAAIGAIQKFSHEYNQLAIVKGDVPNVLDQTSFVVQVGDVTGNTVKPVGATASAVQEEIERRERIRRRRENDGNENREEIKAIAVGVAIIAGGVLVLAYVGAILGFLPGGYGGCLPGPTGDCPLGTTEPTIDVTEGQTEGALSVNVTDASSVENITVKLTGPYNESRYQAITYTVTEKQNLSNANHSFNYTVPEGEWRIEVTAGTESGPITNTTNKTIDYAAFENVSIDGSQVPAPSQDAIQAEQSWNGTQYRIQLDEPRIRGESGARSANQTVRIEVGNRVVAEYNSTEWQTNDGVLSGNLSPPANDSSAPVRIVYDGSGNEASVVAAMVEPPESASGQTGSAENTTATPTPTPTANTTTTATATTNTTSTPTPTPTANTTSTPTPTPTSNTTSTPTPTPTSNTTSTPTPTPTSNTTTSSNETTA